MRPIGLLSLAVVLSASASAQVSQYFGPSPNLTTQLDFDNPFVASGPISSTSTAFTNAGIASVSVIGANFVSVGDTLTAASNAMGQGLAVQGGQLAVVGVGDAIDDIGTGSGFSIELANPADEFQVLFIDQTDMNYAIELFSGGTSIGATTFTYNGSFPNPPHYWRGTQAFDRVDITFPNTNTIGVGIDEIAFGNGALAEPAECAETGIGGNNQGNNTPGGTVYFDLAVSQPISLSGLTTNTTTTAGSQVGLSVYIAQTTSVGNELDPTAWTLVAEDDGTSVSAGTDMPTIINFVAPLSLTPGTYGVALVGENLTTGGLLNHRYKNGTGNNQHYESPDGVLVLDLGTASNVAFVAPLFSPRVWNGILCYGPPPIGTPYCGPAVANSSGASATMAVSGSASVAANDLTLECTGMPQNAFGFFLTSRMQGFVANPGGSQGNLCLGGSIGRYVGPGQVQNSGAAGAMSLLVDNSMHPTPTGLVQVLAGDTWNFQGWFRDSVSGMATSNFSDALEIVFQ